VKRSKVIGGKMIRSKYNSTVQVFKGPNGEYHNDGAPAVIWSDGDEWWYKHGLLHREDGPAMCNPKTLNHNVWYFEGDRKMDTTGPVTPKQVKEFKLKCIK